MGFATRVSIAILSGIGSGTTGFWLAWNFVRLALRDNPALGYDAWLVGGIFAPGVFVSALVFVILSRESDLKRVSRAT
jgi:hypothetical protein